MKIVIDISEETFNKLPNAELGSNVIMDVLDAVEEGTPLPKGHGRLVDGDALWNKMSYYSDNEGAGVDYLNDDVNPTILRDSAMEVIENAPTIIPAERIKNDK